MKPKEHLDYVFQKNRYLELLENAEDLYRRRGGYFEITYYPDILDQKTIERIKIKGCDFVVGKKEKLQGIRLLNALIEIYKLTPEESEKIKIVEQLFKMPIVLQNEKKEENGRE